MLFTSVNPTIINTNTTVKEIKKLIKEKEEYNLISSSQEKKEIIKEYLTEVLKLISNTKNVNDIVLNRKDIEIKIAGDEFKQFLIQNIKMDISWEEANRKYSKENIFNNPLLTTDYKMNIFKDFIFHLKENKKKQLRELFENKIGLNQDITWHDAQHMLQNDKIFRDVLDREREALFNEYKIYVQEKVLSEFNSFLSETTLITKDSPLEGHLFNNLITKLNSDIRFQRLGRNPDKIDKFLRSRIRSLMYEFEKKERNDKKANFNRNRNYGNSQNDDWRKNKYNN